MAGFPVVVVEDFGIPVVSVPEGAPLATVATNGLGTPIVLVEENGTPLVIEGLPEEEGGE